MKKEQVNDEFTRKRAARQRKIRKRRIIITLIVIIVLLIATGVVLSLTVFFPIKNISVSGSTVYSESQVIASLGLEVGDNMWAFSDEKISNRVRKQLPYAESLEFERSFDGQLKIKVKDAVEHFCYNDNVTFYVISKDGWVLNYYDALPENLIELKAEVKSCKLGNEIVFKNEKDKQLFKDMLILGEENNLNINSIDITDKLSLTIKTENRFLVDLGSENNLISKYKHLAGMIKNISAEKKGKINLSMWTSSKPEGTFIPEKQ